MQYVQEHSRVSKLNNGDIQNKLRSIKLTGKGLFEMTNETYLCLLNKKEKNLLASNCSIKTLFAISKFEKCIPEIFAKVRIKYVIRPVYIQKGI